MSISFLKGSDNCFPCGHNSFLTTDENVKLGNSKRHCSECGVEVFPFTSDFNKNVEKCADTPVKDPIVKFNLFATTLIKDEIKEKEIKEIKEKEIKEKKFITAILFEEIPEESNFFLVEGNYKHLNKIYINSNSKEKDLVKELTALIYDDEGGKKLESKSVLSNKDRWDLMIKCGIFS